MLCDISLCSPASEDLNSLSQENGNVSDIQKSTNMPSKSINDISPTKNVLFVKRKRNELGKKIRKDYEADGRRE